VNQHLLEAIARGFPFGTSAHRPAVASAASAALTAEVSNGRHVQAIDACIKKDCPDRMPAVRSI